MNLRSEFEDSKGLRLIEMDKDHEESLSAPGPAPLSHTLPKVQQASSECSNGVHQQPLDSELIANLSAQRQGWWPQTSPLKGYGLTWQNCWH